MLVIDRSGSMDETQARQQRHLISGVAEALSFGDRLIVMVAHRSGVKGASPLVVQMPGARRADRPLSHEERALRTAKRLAIQATDPLFRGGPVPGTDLLATLHTVSDLVDGAPGGRVSLLMLSDMLQCAEGVCFERNGQAVPGSKWIRAQQQQGTLPRLPGVCVAVVGADASTTHGVRVRNFWSAYFQAAGARLDTTRWRHVVADVNAVLCA